MKTLYTLFIFLLPLTLCAQKQAFERYIETDSASFVARDILSTENGTYTVFSMQIIRGLEPTLIVKTDSLGNLLWYKYFGQGLITRNQQLFLAPDGHIDCVGESFELDFGNTDIFWLRLDQEGDILHQKVFGSLEYENIYDISYKANGDMVWTGAVSDLEGEYDLFIQQISADGMLGTGILYDFGIFNFPFDLQKKEDEWLVSFRYTDRITSINQGALLHLAEDFKLIEAYLLNSNSLPMIPQVLAYDTASNILHVFVQAERQSGVVRINDQFEIVGDGSFFAREFEAAGIDEMGIYFLTRFGEFARIVDDSISGRIYNVKAQYADPNTMDYLESSNALYAAGSIRGSGPSTGVLMKSFISRNMSCGSFSYLSDNAEALNPSIVNINGETNEANFQIADLQLSFDTIPLREGDSCRVECRDPLRDVAFLQQELTVEMTILDPDSSADYEWVFNDSFQTSGYQAFYTFPRSGTYEICVYAFNACGSDSACLEVTVMSTSAEDASSEEYILYPNPAKDFLNIKPFTAVSSIEAIDLYGRSTALTARQGRVPLSSLHPATYILKITTTNGSVYYRKLLKL